MERRPGLDTRRERLVAYLRHNRDAMVVDCAMLLAWVAVTTLVFRVLTVPLWPYFLLLFVGTFAYARLTPGWERPYRPVD